MASTRTQTRSSKRAAAGDGKQVAEGSAAQVVKRRRGNAAANASRTTIDALPDDVLMLVFQRLGFPHRFTAALGEMSTGLLCSTESVEEHAAFALNAAGTSCVMRRRAVQAWWTSFLVAAQCAGYGGAWLRTPASRTGPRAPSTMPSGRLDPATR